MARPVEEVSTTITDHLEPTAVRDLQPLGGKMSNSIHTPQGEPDPEKLDSEAQRWVRRKRILYTILGIYAVLSLMWFAIDMADGTESLWFYWPMLGTGIAVAITAVVLLGVGGVFGIDWEQRQVERYIQQRRRGR
jgi:hypothetical protein